MKPAASLPAFFRLHAFGRIDSTNDRAKALAEDGAAEGTLVIAAEQSAGRGRQGRSWASPLGNLHASLVLRPRTAAREAAQLGFAASLAVAEAAEAVLPLGVAVSLKWPNDVLIAGAKAAGILLESRARGDGALEWLVLGIGVNLGDAPQGTPYPAISFKALGAEVTPAQFLPILAERLLVWYETWRQDGFVALRDPWLARAHRIGDRLNVRSGTVQEEGRFAGLDAEGRLLFQGADGVRPIAAADVFTAPSPETPHAARHQRQ